MESSEEKYEAYENLISEMRRVEQETCTTPAPICVYTNGSPPEILLNLADEGTIEEPMEKPIKQDVLMKYIFA